MTTVGVYVPQKPSVQRPTRNMCVYTYPKPPVIRPKIVMRPPGQVSECTIISRPEKEIIPIPPELTPGKHVHRTESYMYTDSDSRLLRMPSYTTAEKLNISRLSRDLLRHYDTPKELTKARQEWSTFLFKCPERFKFAMSAPPTYLQKNYNLRDLRPDITKHWKHVEPPQPSLARYATCPPQNAWSRFRTSGSRSANPIAWRP